MALQPVTIETSQRDQAINITNQVASLVTKSGVKEGWCRVYVGHTTAGVTINEAADPAVMADVLAHLDRMVPHEAGYTHAEGNSAAHIKSILTGASVTVPVRRGGLLLGTWQGIFFMEFDGPRQRRLLVEVGEAKQGLF